MIKNALKEIGEAIFFWEILMPIYFCMVLMGIRFFDGID